MMHVVWGLVCVWTSAEAVATAWCAAPLTVLARPLAEGSLEFFFGGGPKLFSLSSGGPQPSESMMCTGLG
jgi:hypothetical protein